KAAANNDGGAMQGFIGMGMAQQAGGVNAADLFAMGQAQGGPQSGMGPASPPVAPGGGYVPQAAPPPAPPVAPPPAAPAAYWACACGFAQNAGAFCANCGQPKPVAPAPMGCPRCGWTPDPSLGVAKFCPECGTPLAAG
ncbi:MAG: hypothetical protein FWD55_03590, partial [Propionibacteriaceae bacterium]|nr:hypothetical protein [Propionibacteriaceae bacterium]